MTKHRINRQPADELGQTSLEYALVLGFISVAMVAILATGAYLWLNTILATISDSLP